jgi:hypothetical protein
VYGSKFDVDELQIHEVLDLRRRLRPSGLESSSPEEIESSVLLILFHFLSSISLARKSVTLTACCQKSSPFAGGKKHHLSSAA